MGLLNLLPERRAIDFPLDASRFPYGPAGWVSMSAAGVAVDEDLALGVPTFSTCVLRKQDAMMAMPVDAYVTDGDRRQPVPGPAWLKRPNVEQTWKPFIGDVSWSLDVGSNAYIAVTRDGAGRAAELYVLDHRQMCVARQSGRKIYEYSGREYRGEVVHIPRHRRPGQLCGVSVIDLNRDTFGLAIAIQTYASQFFSSGGIPPVIFEMTGPAADEKSLDGLAKWWKQSRQRGGFHVPGFLYGGTAKLLDVDAQKAQLAQATNDIGVRIADLCGVPPALVGLQVSGNSVPYQNIVDAFIWFMRQAMLAPMELIQEALSDDEHMLMPKAQRVRFRTEIFEKPDTQGRYQIYQIGLDAGFLTIDDVRAWEDLPPLSAEDTVRLGKWTVDPTAGTNTMPDAAMPAMPAAPKPVVAA